MRGLRVFCLRLPALADMRSIDVSLGQEANHYLVWNPGRLPSLQRVSAWVQILPSSLTVPRLTLVSLKVGRSRRRLLLRFPVFLGKGNQSLVSFHKVPNPMSSKWLSEFELLANRLPLYPTAPSPQHGMFLETAKCIGLHVRSWGLLLIISY